MSASKITESGERSRDALAATAAVDTGGANVFSARATPAPSFDPSKSVTPGPVVVENQQETTHVRKSKAPLFAVLGLLVVGGGVAAFVVMNQKKEGSGTGTGTGTSAQIQIDASVVVPPPATPDAAVPVVETREGMVRYEGGTFDMGVDPKKFKGNPTVEATHSVTVAPYFLDKTEAAGDDGMPLTKVSWTAAKEHCEKAGKRLPTAAEWEHAARSGKLGDGNLRGKTGGGPKKVASHPGDCTGDGVCDLLGNVMEWTADEWGEGAPAGSKVVRGASYTVAPAAGWYASIHARLPLDEETADAEIGFRCAADVKGSP